MRKGGGVKWEKRTIKERERKNERDIEGNRREGREGERKGKKSSEREGGRETGKVKCLLISMNLSDIAKAV